MEKRPFGVGETDFSDTSWTKKKNEKLKQVYIKTNDQYAEKLQNDSTRQALFRAADPSSEVLFVH